jgi:hypothetical protein
MRFLGNRGYLLHKSLHGPTRAGAVLSRLNRGRSNAAGGHFVPGNNTSGGVVTLAPSQTRIQLGTKSPQVALARGPGARVVIIDN